MTIHTVAPEHGDAGTLIARERAHEPGRQHLLATELPDFGDGDPRQ